ncbi:MAG: TolC family protein [Pirellulaceae bacterium]
MPERPQSALPTFASLLLLAGLAVAGCHWRSAAPSPVRFATHSPSAPTAASELRMEKPAVAPANNFETLAGLPPQTLRTETAREPWPLTLQQAIEIALANSETFREAGGRVVPNPEAIISRYDPALQENDPRFGVPAALSDFDAQFTTGLFFGRNERVLNNLATQGTRMYQQDYAELNAAISKRTAAGTQLFGRHVTQYDANNSPTSLFPNAYETWFEAGVRQPLLQGAGIDFNRIAGPNARPGEYNGVMIARLRTDRKLVDFQLAARDLVRDVEQLYWELYYAYREADARRENLERTQHIWRIVRDNAEGEQVARSVEALARERLYSAEAELQNALSGTPVEARAHITGNPQPLATHGGVYSLERRLRYLLGLPSSDERLIRPIDDPISAEVLFDWYESMSLAIYCRPELHKQQWLVKQRELELLASRGFGRARVDLVGDVRWRGFGDDLFGNAGVPNGSAFGHLFEGGTQEYRVGVQVDTPVGNRIGFTAIRHAELALAREKSVYKNQELQVSHELNGAFNELHRSLATIRTNYNKREAAHARLDALYARFEHRTNEEADPLLDWLFIAQQRVVAADLDYFRSISDYNIAIARLHVARGTYLDYVNVHLAEAPWSAEVYQFAAENARRFRPNHAATCLVKPQPVSVGPLPQEFEDAAPPAAVHSPAELENPPALPLATEQPQSTLPRLLPPPPVPESQVN